MIALENAWTKSDILPLYIALLCLLCIGMIFNWFQTCSFNYSQESLISKFCCNALRTTLNVFFKQPACICLFTLQGQHQLLLSDIQGSKMDVSQVHKMKLFYQCWQFPTFHEIWPAWCDTEKGINIWTPKWQNETCLNEILSLVTMLWEYKETGLTLGNFVTWYAKPSLKSSRSFYLCIKSI